LVRPFSKRAYLTEFFERIAGAGPYPFVVVLVQGVQDEHDSLGQNGISPLNANPTKRVEGSLPCFAVRML
jgi:hypothetical protein